MCGGSDEQNMYKLSGKVIVRGREICYDSIGEKRRTKKHSLLAENAFLYARNGFYHPDTAVLCEILPKEVFMRFHFFKSSAARKSHERYGLGEMTCDEEIVEGEIARFLAGEKRSEMYCGARYYLGEQDILQRERTAIGSGGKTVSIDNLPCARIVDNRYRMLVDQKTDYLLGRPLTWSCGNEAMTALLDRVFDARLLRTLKGVCRTAYNEGIAWLYIYYDAQGTLSFRAIPGHEVMAVWRDEGHTDLEYAARIYDGEEQCGKQARAVRLCEVYDERGIHFFSLSEKGKLTPRAPRFVPYFTRPEKGGEALCAGEGGCGFGRIPLVPFRCNAAEQPLIHRVKSLQDGLNTILSNFQDVMQEDVRNTILVLVNYDGEDLGEFRRNLATYGAVKVKSVDGVSGDLKTLQIAVNHENYESILEQLRRSIVENGMGFDVQLLREGRQLNELNIRSFYADMDLDANDTEGEWQASLAEVVWFLRRHCALCGIGVGEEPVRFLFNRDMLMDEREIIGACVDSLQLLSRKTVIENHPWVNDVAAELKRIECEQKGENNG